MKTRRDFLRLSALAPVAVVSARYIDLGGKKPKPAFPDPGTIEPNNDRVFVRMTATSSLDPGDIVVYDGMGVRRATPQQAYMAKKDTFIGIAAQRAGLGDEVKVLVRGMVDVKIPRGGL